MSVIAIIDDNERLLEAMGRMFDGTGYHAVLFDNAEEALNAFMEAPVDLVISDIFMPGMNGFQFIEKLRALMPTVPVIAISGGGRFPGADVLSESKDYSAEATLPKPVRRAELIALIETTLKGRG